MQINFRKTVGVASVFSALAMLTGPVLAGGFADAYQAALSYDPKLQGARFERDAGLQAVPLAKAGLLPSLSFSASRPRVHGYRELPNQQGTTTEQDLSYAAPQRSLNLRVPLFNPEGIMRYRQAETQAAYSEVQLTSRTLELVDRLGQAYFRALLAEEELKLLQAQVNAFSEQRRLTQRRLQGGEGTRTEVAEADARLDLAQAQLLDAKDNIEVSRRDLQAITGKDASVIAPVKPDFLPPVMAPDSVQTWLTEAYEKSALIQGRRLALEAARIEVSKSFSGHLPRVDLVGGISKASNESLSTLNQTTLQKSIGIQLNVPLYSGGYVNALTQQSRSMLQKAQTDLDAELAATELSVRRGFLLAVSGSGKMQAYKKAVDSSEVALDGVRRGLQAGYRTNVDVLDAQRQVFSAKRDLAQARYDYLMSRLRLFSAAGYPAQAVVAEIDQYLMQ
jgi:protease secretion system outer membrane protein